jgi:hypothetical protein
MAQLVLRAPDQEPSDAAVASRRVAPRPSKGHGRLKEGRSKHKRIELRVHNKKIAVWNSNVQLSSSNAPGAKLDRATHWMTSNISREQLNFMPWRFRPRASMESPLACRVGG